MENTDNNTQTPGKAPHAWHNSRKRFFLPLLFVAVGGLLLARALGVNIPDWIFSWQVLLIGAGITSGIVEKFRGGAWLVMVLVGSFFLADDLIPGADFHKFLWPVGLIALGLLLFLRPKKPFCDGRNNHWNRFNRHRMRRAQRMARYQQRPLTGFNPPVAGPYQPSDPGLTGQPMGATNTGTSGQFHAGDPRFDQYNPGYSGGNGYRPTSSEDFIDATVVLGAVQKNIVSKDFRGGDITVFMGGTEINLTQADIQGTAVLDVTQIMGGTKLIVPPHWEIQTRITSVFGNVEDKRIPGTTLKDKVLILDGTSVFGGIEIRSY